MVLGQRVRVQWWHAHQPADLHELLLFSPLCPLFCAAPEDASGLPTAPDRHLFVPPVLQQNSRRIDMPNLPYVVASFAWQLRAHAGVLLAWHLLSNLSQMPAIVHFGDFRPVPPPDIPSAQCVRQQSATDLPAVWTLQPTGGIVCEYSLRFQALKERAVQAHRLDRRDWVTSARGQITPPTVPDWTIA